MVGLDLNILDSQQFGDPSTGEFHLRMHLQADAPIDVDRLEAERQRLVAELGVDVEILEARLVFGIDAARIGRGEPAELTYIRIKRHHAPNALIVAPAGDAGGRSGRVSRFGA